MHADGSVVRIYAHWGGLPGENGEILLNNYSTTDKVEEMIEGGDMSTLGNTPEECKYYKDRANEDPEEIKPERFSNITDALRRNSDTEFFYLWDVEAQRWFYSEDDRVGSREKLMVLTPEAWAC